MREWKAACLEFRLIFDECSLFSAAEALALSLGFDAFAFVMLLPTSVADPAVLVYGRGSIPGGDDCCGAFERRARVRSQWHSDPVVRRARASMLGMAWHGSAPGAWSYALPPGMTSGWAQPTRGPGITQGVACVARASGRIDEEEADRIEQRLFLLGATLHEQLAHIAIQERELFVPLRHDEQDVLRLSADGLSAKKIADFLGIKEHTAENTLARCRGKMKVSTNSQQAVLLANNWGLLNL